MRSLVRSRGRRESGAAAVEFALLLPIFAMLTIGMLTFGLAFERWLTGTSAAREASRFAATYPLQGTAEGPGVSDPDVATEEWAQTVLDVATEAAGLDLDPDKWPPDEEFGICVSFTNEVGPGNFGSVVPGVTKRWWRGDLIPTGDSTTPCTPPDLPDNRVAVTVSRDAPLNWVVFSTDNVVTGRNTSRFEPTLE